MSNIKVENLDSQAVPFFARFLENQDCEDVSAEETEKISGGIRVVTLRYPSDSDVISVTRRYPSDHESISTYV
ncbi:MAG TPA: microviridin/marinostatin family tricyclic proteinase inhibitor [Nostocaceae cyanobacterium]|nr:microviridin/marinostatin family tricyclic proteinase inhibitor [Nostocaceae cyanobacterium]